MLSCKDNVGKLQLIESAIEHQRVLELTDYQGKKITLLPIKLLELTGEVCVIGEVLETKQLMDVSLKLVDFLVVISSDFQLTFTAREVDFYIKKIREVEGGAARLVLKVSHAVGDIGHPGKLQHLGSHYMTTNAEGDLIWAATVEINFDLFEWLFSLKDEMVILDPTNIKSEFENYCHYRQNKGA